MRGTTLIGLLVVTVMLLVLAVVLSNALRKATTGAGSVLPGTAASHEDRRALATLQQSMAVYSQLREGRFLVPSELTRSRDPGADTTANLFSAMIAQNYVQPGQLVSAVEVSPYVWADEDYDYAAYAPARDVHWDPAFVADLAVESNDSFAHPPLYGRRLRQHWQFTADHRTPLFGSRGPEGGVRDPASYTCEPDGRWAGHAVFGDGHVEFLETFTPEGLFYDSAGQALPDNLFRMEQGPDGADAILTFTKAMTPDGPVIQHD